MAQSDEGWDWSFETVRRIGAAMKAVRGRRSAKWLSDRTAELGWRVSPTVIAKLDSGHRAGLLTVPELLVIAAALEVPPLALLYPDLPDGDVEVLPGQHVSATASMLRFTGETDMSPRSDLGRLAQLSRERFGKQIRRKNALELLDKRVRDATDDDEAAENILAVIDKAEGLRDLERRIREIPGSVVKDDE